MKTKGLALFLLPLLFCCCFGVRSFALPPSIVVSGSGGDGNIYNNLGDNQTYILEPDLGHGQWYGLAGHTVGSGATFYGPGIIRNYNRWLIDPKADYYSGTDASGGKFDYQGPPSSADPLSGPYGVSPPGGDTSLAQYTLGIAPDPTVTAYVAPGTISLAPTTLQSGAGTQTVTITGTGTNFSTTSTTQFTLSGGTGASIISQSASSTTAATLSLNPGTQSGTLTINDATDNATATITVNAVSVSLNPSAATAQTGTTVQFTPTVTGNGSNSSEVTWTATGGTVTSSGLFTAPSSVMSSSVTATSVLDPTKSATAIVTITGPTPPTAPTIALDNSGTTDTIIVYTFSAAGTNTLVGYTLYRGDTAGNEAITAVATSNTGIFTGLTKGRYFYVVRGYDNAASPNYSVASNEVNEGGASVTLIPTRQPSRGR